MLGAAGLVGRDTTILPAERADDGRWRGITGALSANDLTEARIAMPPPKLEALPGLKNFDLQGTPQELFEKVCAAFGLEVIFDRDYQAPPPIRFRVTEVNYQDALRVLEAVTNTFVTPISEKKLLAARDTAQKRQELQSTMAIALEIPARLSVQDAQELVAVVQQIFEIRRITVDPKRKLIFIRDAVTKAIAAKRMLEDMALYRPQITLDLEMLGVSASSSLSAGVNLQTTAPLVNFGKVAFGSFASAPAAFTNFMTFGGGKTFFGLGIAAASVFANQTDTSAVSIIKAQMMAMDGMPSSFHVGDKYPIQSNAYIGSSSGQSGQVYLPPPTFTFEDLGVVLKVTPQIHGTDEVTLDIESEFKVLGNGSLNGIPIISTKKFTGKVRLKMGECAVVAGLMTLNESGSIDGIPGLAKIPFLRQNNKSKDRTETLLVLTPRLISLPPGEFVTRSIWLGSETHPLSPL
jgi:type II secretory pathway component GspD/PulD (secretin)